MARPKRLVIDKDDILRHFVAGLLTRISELEAEIPGLPRGPLGWALLELDECKTGWLRYDLPTLAGRFLTPYQAKKYRAAIREMRDDGLVVIDDGAGKASAIRLTVKGLDRLKELSEAK